jgi:hypothetical protein
VVVSAGKFPLVFLLAPNGLFLIYSALLVLGDKPAPLADFAHHAAVGYRLPEAMEQLLLRLTVS